jgi:hypothetical protein
MTHLAPYGLREWAKLGGAVSRYVVPSVKVPAALVLLSSALFLTIVDPN